MSIGFTLRAYPFSAFDFDDDPETTFFRERNGSCHVILYTFYRARNPLAEFQQLPRPHTLIQIPDGQNTDRHAYYLYQHTAILSSPVRLIRGVLCLRRPSQPSQLAASRDEASSIIFFAHRIHLGCPYSYPIPRRSLSAAPAPPSTFT